MSVPGHRNDRKPECRLFILSNECSKHLNNMRGEALVNLLCIYGGRADP